MEFWEGAVLVVGGIWLIGRLSRQSPNHPVNSVPVSLGVAGGSLNPTTATNTDGSSSLTVGEPFGPGLVPTSLGAGASSSPACCGASKATTPATVGVGASTGVPRTPVRTLPSYKPQPDFGTPTFRKVIGFPTAPTRYLPATQVPVTKTAVSPAVSAPRPPVRFYAV